MAFNRDINSIFDKYVNNILEAVNQAQQLPERLPNEDYFTYTKRVNDQLRNSSNPPSYLQPVTNTTTPQPPKRDPKDPTKLEAGPMGQYEMGELGKVQQMQNLDKSDPSFSQWQQNNVDQAEKRISLPTGPTVDAANQINASTGQKLVQATTGNKPTNTGAATDQEASLMKTLHGSFNPNAPADKAKLDILRQVQQELGPNATENQIANKAYAMQQSQASQKAMPGAGNKPGQIKTPAPTQQQAPQQQTGVRRATPANLPPGYVERQNSSLPGVLGTASNMLGRAGDTAKNVAMGTVGRVNPQPTQQQSNTQQRRPVNPKTR
jgi:hypothetical protein